MKNIKFIVKNAAELAEFQEIVRLFLGEKTESYATMSCPYGNVYYLQLEISSSDKIRIDKRFIVFEISIKEKEGSTNKEIKISYKLPETFKSRTLIVSLESYASELSFILA